jgi:hypothetical protein
MSQNKKQQLELVAGFVPSAIKSVVQRIAKENDRSTSWVVRKLLEESPRVKSALRGRLNGSRRQKAA